MRALASTGDECHTWDGVAAAQGDLDAQAAVREAERIFNEHRAHGGLAILRRAGTKDVVIEAFDPSHGDILLLTPIIGG